MVGALALEQPRIRKMLGQVAAVTGPDNFVLAVLDDESRCGDERQDLADVELERRRIIATAVPGLAALRSTRPYQS